MMDALTPSPEMLAVASRNIRSFIKLSRLDEASNRAALACIEVLEAARQVPDGYVLVPVEPTDVMLDAPGDVGVGCPTWAGNQYHCDRTEAEAIWAAMIAARPQELK